MGAVDRFDRFQRQHPVLGFPIAVAYKFFDDFGGYLAALITYYAFVSLFPLLLLLVTVLSWVLSSRPDLQEVIIESALRQVPVVGDQLGNPKALSGGIAGVVIGVAVSIYGGLGVGNAVQYALNTVWTIPRNRRPNPLTSRVRSLGVVFIGGLAIVGTTTLSTLAALDLGWFTRPVSLLVTTVANAFIINGVYRWAVSRLMPIRTHLVGSVIAALLLQFLQTFGVVYVGRIVHNASATNGVIGFVLGLLAFVYLVSVVLVLCAEINAVRARQLYPRALLTPFTDNVDLTEADKAAYAAQARAMRTKGYERIDVRFEREESRPPV
ncbi:MAG: YihY/virulence factor BrkB family protein [Actinobacteria bacterium]|nr:YihY/virulence factor BrkB family protein [Actinomycetota bacterium]